MADASPEPLTTEKPLALDPTRALEDAALRELESLSLKDVLDSDSRPTLILDLDPDYIIVDKYVIRPLFCNAALRQHDRLLDHVTGASDEPVDLKGDATTYQEFRDWATGVSRFNDSKDIFPLTLHYRNLLWTGSTVRSRWRIISGNALFQISDIPKGDLLSAKSARPRFDRINSASEIPTKVLTFVPDAPARDVRSNVQQLETSSTAISKTTNMTSSSITLGTPENFVPDWTVSKPNGFLSDHIILVRRYDWSSTPLGPMEQWSTGFREVVNLLMRNPHPAALFWGEEFTMIYNEAYTKEVAGAKHPDLLGTGFSGPFSELWDGVAPIFRECARTGQSIRKENDPLPIERYGYLEETFFSWSFVPIFGGGDRILGFYNAPFETTYQTIAARRMGTLRHLGECLNATRTVKQFWKRVLDGLEPNHYDVPFALLYSIVDADDADTASHSSDSTISLKSCVKEGSIGIPQGHPAAPHKLDLKRSQDGFIPAFREAMRTREPTTLHTQDGTLPEGLLEGIKWRGYGDPCKEAIIFPVRPTNGDNVCAFLLIGINPRRAYDDDYKSFSNMVLRQLATSLASVLLFEDEVRRSRHAAEVAALQREQLSQQLELQTSRMRRMTELSPLGMYFFDPDGRLVEANERYYEMTGHPRDSNDELSFLAQIEDNSKATAQNMWDDMMRTHTPSTAEIRLKDPKIQPQDLSGDPIEYWVLATSSPEIGKNGEVISIMGSITDISHIKWAQGLQERRLIEAEETKRQQNEFIDITSHEMRNPLSAILICADDIRDTLMQHEFTGDEERLANECIEAANNIALCVQHQKSIVDDILTVSKLDSNLLLITPVPSQPVAVVQRGVNMFKPEVQAKNIEFAFVPHESLTHFDIDWVLLDPSRLLQITVNLITNAIKFTANCQKRCISVHVSASPDQPDLTEKGFQFVPTRGTATSVATGEEWGSGQLFYLRVEVQDSGCGLTAEERDLLFEKFAQASPRTHAHYGGSGLGLFISRQLAELHGGQIGVKSEAGSGSTFGFFLQCRRMQSQHMHPQHMHPPLSRNPSLHPENPHHMESFSDLVAAISTSTTEKATPAATTPSSDPNQLHILIVEDNLVNQKVLSKQLTKAGCIINTADNGLFALEHLVKTSFYTPTGIPLSVILMDLEMPEMDGLTCCKRIREMEEKGELSGHVPIIAVTANVRGEQIATAKESGMDDVVSKPFRIPQLMEKIQGLLQRLADG